MKTMPGRLEELLQRFNALLPHITALPPDDLIEVVKAMRDDQLDLLLEIGELKSQLQEREADCQAAEQAFKLINEVHTRVFGHSEKKPVTAR